MFCGSWSGLRFILLINWNAEVEWQGGCRGNFVNSLGQLRLWPSFLGAEQQGFARMLMRDVRSENVNKHLSKARSGFRGFSRGYFSSVYELFALRRSALLSCSTVSFLFCLSSFLWRHRDAAKKDSLAKCQGLELSAVREIRQVRRSKRRNYRLISFGSSLFIHPYLSLSHIWECVRGRLCVCGCECIKSTRAWPKNFRPKRVQQIRKPEKKIFFK